MTQTRHVGLACVGLLGVGLFGVACSSPGQQTLEVPGPPPRETAPISAPPPPPPVPPSRVVGCGPATRPRSVFDPPGERHSLPDLAWNGSSYLVVGYGDAAAGMVLTRLTAGAAANVSLGVGTQPSIALGATRLGVVFTDFDAEPTRVEIPPPQPGEAPPYREVEPSEPPPTHIMVQQGQTYFLSTTRDGDAPSARVAVGDTSANHTTPGTSIGWSAAQRTFGLVWTEQDRARFARVSESGQVGPVLDLAPGAAFSLHDDARVVATARGFAVPIQIAGESTLIEIEGDAVVRRTPLARDVMELEAAFDGRRVAVLMRTATELDVVHVENGVLGERRTIARAAQGRHIGAPELAFDGAAFVAVWPDGAQGFDDRLCFARLDAQGAPVAGHPVRLDGEEVHQGYASIAGSGATLAVSYILGDPNGAVRVGLVQGL